jgi:ABC-type multidrug transport system fused ATPase/permease subunit
MKIKRIPFWKHFLFSEARPLVDVGRTRILQDEDMLQLPEDQVPPELEWFEKKLNFSSPAKLIFSNMNALGWKFRRALLLNFLTLTLGLANPVLVNRFIQALSHATPDTPFMSLAMWGLLLAAATIAQGLSMQHYFYDILGSEQISTRVLNRKVYLHSLRLSYASRGKTPVGDVVNHMSSDSDGVSEFVFIFSDIFEAVLTTIGVSVLLFYYLGWTAVVPLVLFFILAPLTKKLAGRFTHLDDEMMKWRDQRVSLMTQILNAIRIVKYFVWEKSVYNEVNQVRENELRARMRMAKTEVMASAVYTSVSTVVLFAALGTHVLRGQSLDVALIFTCISLFGLLENPLGRMSNLISRSTTSFVGAKRLLEFFKKDLIPPKAEVTLSAKPCGVRAENLSAEYELQDELVLSNLNFEIKPGESLAIVGSVGCGKSTLLLSLLGELPHQGQIEFPNSDGIKSRRAFCPQEAYIINGSLAENLSFGEKVTEAELQKALKVTALEQDLKLFPAGLNTEIGEKGVNLSGGQKQRVALARAYLSKPGIVFLDDPLSAVDVETEKHIVDELLFGAWKGITRVVATHRMESLPHFDKVLFLKDGKEEALGSFEEIMQHNSFAQFYSAHHDINKAETSVTAGVSAQEKQETHSRITEDEEREQGAVKSRVYLDYILSLGGVGKYRNLILVLMFLGTTSVVVLPLAQKAWLSKISSLPNVFDGVMVYGLLGIITLGVTLMNGLFWLIRGVEAGRYLHNKMLRSILGAPVRFFDSTPVGRILQRFSRDVESVDVYLQWTFDSAMNCFIQIIVTMILIAAVLPSMILVMAPVFIFYYFLQRDYRRPAREIKRLDSLARSPRYAHFKETLMGLTVIRSFDKESWFIENFRQKLVKSQNTFYNAYIINRWFSVRVPILGGVIASATLVLLSMAVQRGYITAGTGGLLTVYSLSFWGYLNWGIRVFSDIETRMTSIERLKFYSNLPQEKGHSFEWSENQRWPKQGEIRFENVKLRYAPHLPLVLKGVSFSIRHGERIGLIGRTGSGKSTLLQTLFRFVEPESGKIFLDGKEIHEVFLPDLRRNLAIIPQDPILFMGTVRSNLDRYNQYSDAEIQRALMDASMWAFISSLPMGLETPVNENGNNFSQGQRQLLCLARALLVKAKVVAMDEATASVDVQTDVIIQRVIRENLKDATLLIIAHRLGTVMDCDRIIEMSQGEVKDIWDPRKARKTLTEMELK